MKVKILLAFILALFIMCAAVKCPAQSATNPSANANNHKLPNLVPAVVGTGCIVLGIRMLIEKEKGAVIAILTGIGCYMVELFVVIPKQQ